LTICYPYVSLEPIVTKLSGQNWIDATKKKNAAEDRLVNETNLAGVTGELSAVLLRSRIKVRDFLSLKLGDIIPYEKKIDLPIEVLVNRRHKYLGRPGLSGKKRAVQVVEVLPNMMEELKHG
jgi:flagellar motor switch protein FliM